MKNDRFPSLGEAVEDSQIAPSGELPFASGLRVPVITTPPPSTTGAVGQVAVSVAGFFFTLHRFRCFFVSFSPGFRLHFFFPASVAWTEPPSAPARCAGAAARRADRNRRRQEYRRPSHVPPDTHRPGFLAQMPVS